MTVIDGFDNTTLFRKNLHKMRGIKILLHCFKDSKKMFKRSKNN